MDLRWMRSSVVTSSVLGVAFAFVACSEGQEATSDIGADDRVRFKEEEGVQSIEVDGLWSTDWPELPGVTFETLVLPSSGDEFGLVAPLHAAYLSDGRMILADVGTSTIWVRNPDGSWSQGPGPGQGPGELRSVGGVWPDEDGFVVHDPASGDLVQFSAEGSLIERRAAGVSLALHGARGEASYWTPSIQKIEEDHWLVAVAEMAERTDPQANVEAQIRFVWFSESPPGEERSIAEGPAQPMVVVGGGWAPVLFSPSAVGAGGSGRVAVSSGRSPEVEVFDRTGGVTTRVRWTDTPMPLDASHRGALGAFMRANLPPEAPAEAVDQLVASYEAVMTYPAAMPHLGALRLGPGGDLWLGWPERSGLELPTKPELIREWRVVVPATGEAPARVFKVNLPENSTVLGLGENAAGEEGLFLLIRDEVERQGVGFLQYDAGP